MAWTTPRTWVTSEVVTAAIMNTAVRDNFTFLHNAHGVRCTQSAAQTIGSGATAEITWDTEDFDTDGYHSLVTNNSRITIPSGLAGFYHVVFAAATDADTAQHNGRFLPSIVLNATTEFGQQSYSGHAFAQVGWSIITLDLAAGDFIEARVQSLTEARDITTQAYFEAFWQGA